MDRDRKKGGISGLGGLLKDMARSRGWELRFARGKLWEVWEEAVGAQIAAKAWPVRFMERDVLVVVVSDSIWMQQLAFQRRMLVERMNGFLSAEARIRDVKFVFGDVDETRAALGAKPRPKGRADAIRKGRVDPAVAEEAEAAVQGIEDEGLRQALKTLYLRHRLARKDSPPEEA